MKRYLKLSGFEGVNIDVLGEEEEQRIKFLRESFRELLGEFGSIIRRPILIDVDVGKFIGKKAKSVYINLFNGIGVTVWKEYTYIPMSDPLADDIIKPIPSMPDIAFIIWSLKEFSIKGKVKTPLLPGPFGDDERRKKFTEYVRSYDEFSEFKKQISKAERRILNLIVNLERVSLYMDENLAVDIADDVLRKKMLNLRIIKKKPLHLLNPYMLFRSITGELRDEVPVFRILDALYEMALSPASRRSSEAFSKAASKILSEVDSLISSVRHEALRKLAKRWGQWLRGGFPC